MVSLCPLTLREDDRYELVFSLFIFYVYKHVIRSWTEGDRFLFAFRPSQGYLLGLSLFLFHCFTSAASAIQIKSNVGDAPINP